jgi:hypothetical protein
MTCGVIGAGRGNSRGWKGYWATGEAAVGRHRRGRPRRSRGSGNPVTFPSPRRRPGPNLNWVARYARTWSHRAGDPLHGRGAAHFLCLAKESKQRKSRLRRRPFGLPSAARSSRRASKLARSRLRRATCFGQSTPDYSGLPCAAQRLRRQPRSTARPSPSPLPVRGEGDMLPASTLQVMRVGSKSDAGANWPAAYASSWGRLPAAPCA